MDKWEHFGDTAVNQCGLVLDTPEKQFYPVASGILPESSFVWYWLTGSDVTRTRLARQHWLRHVVTRDVVFLQESYQKHNIILNKFG